MSKRLRERLVVVAVAAGCSACLGLSACGGSASSTDTDATARYLSSGDLGDYAAGSPQRAVLQWWQAVQFANAGLARSFYSAAARPPLDRMQRELAAASRQFAGVPHFESAAVDGKTATLYLLTGRSKADATPQALSVNLVKSEGRWRLADDQLLGQMVARVERAAAERRN